MMDKRTLLFAICITLAFFGMQAYFGTKSPLVPATLSQTPPTSSVSLLAAARSTEAISRGDSTEEFYVLQTATQQLVFSTKGGALAEINLPFRSPTNQISLVKEIEPDRQILEQNPPNAHFPLRPAYFVSDSGETVLMKPQAGGYYPLLRRSLLNRDTSLLHAMSSKNYAFNIISADDLSFQTADYTVTRFEKNLIEFAGNLNGTRIIKRFYIPEEHNGPYCFELAIHIDGPANGLWLTSGVPEAELLSGSFSPLIRYQLTRGNSLDVETVDLTDKQPVKLISSIQPNWVSNSNGFLGLILDPLSNAPPGYRALKLPGREVPTRLSLIDPTYQLYPVDKYPGYMTYLPLKGSVDQVVRAFAGPYDDTLLKSLDDFYEDPVHHTRPDYASAQSIQGWFSFISQPFAKFLYFLLQIFYSVTHSWGFSIILLTIALRLMMIPLNNWTIRSQLRMQEIAPKIKAIQERYKKDPKKMQLEQMNLYRQEGINPFSGCIPMLLQMPFLIGMFYLLKSTFPLRGASFIPGWIDNLAAPDILFTWSYPIPLIGTEFHLLPIFLGLAMYWQQKMSAKLPKDVKDLSDTQKQQKMMATLMPIIFTVMFYGFPSGLNIYFISSTLLGILQQWILTKRMALAPFSVTPIKK